MMKHLTEWSSSEAEVADIYGDMLNSLKKNSEGAIDILTELANKYSNKHPYIVVYCIETRTRDVSNELKLTVMYLMDSIIKKYAEPFQKLFAKNVVSTFLHVFKCSNEKVRALLLNMRSTWTVLFPREIMLSLDQAVNRLDPTWVITKPNIHTNPKITKDSAINIETDSDTGTDSSSSEFPSSSTVSEINQKEIELREAKIDLKLQQDKIDKLENEIAEEKKRLVKKLKRKLSKLKDRLNDRSRSKNRHQAQNMSKTEDRYKDRDYHQDPNRNQSQYQDRQRDDQCERYGYDQQDRYRSESHQYNRGRHNHESRITDRDRRQDDRKSAGDRGRQRNNDRDRKQDHQRDRKKYDHNQWERHQREREQQLQEAI